jgi:3-isopropylmalate dehydrogenase
LPDVSPEAPGFEAPGSSATTSAHLTLGVLEGDDIGHEIVPAAVEIATAAATKAGLDIEWVELPIGRRALEREGHTLPERTLATLETLDGWILGPIGHRNYPRIPEAVNPHPILRKRFDLFGNVRPTRSFPGIGGHFDDIDLVIVRENNEGFQPDRNVVAGSGEFRPTEDVTISVRVISRNGSRKVAEAALAVAMSRPRKKLTIVHKDTVFKLGCGMFVEECRRAAEAFPEVEVDEVIVDTFALRLLRDPQSFDTVVTTNMFGDILTDEASMLAGSLGLLPSASLGAGTLGVYEPIHGSAPDIAGRGVANPYATMLSAAMLLRHSLGLHEESAALEKAVAASISAGVRTADIASGGSVASTADAGDAVVSRLLG